MLETTLEWFDNDNYSKLHELTIEEFYLELELRHGLLCKSKFNKKQREFWLKNICHESSPYASQYGADYEFAHDQEFNEKIKKLRDEFKHKTLSSKFNVWPVSIDEVQSKLGIVTCKNSLSIEGIDKGKKGFTSMPLSYLFHRMVPDTSNITVNINLNSSDIEIRNSIDELLLQWRKELKIQPRVKGLLQNATTKYLVKCLEQKIIQILDIIFFCDENLLKHPAKVAIMDLVYDGQDKMSESNFSKRVLGDTIKVIKDPASMNKIKAAMYSGEYDPQTVKIGDLLND